MTWSYGQLSCPRLHHRTQPSFKVCSILPPGSFPLSCMRACDVAHAGSSATQRHPWRSRLQSCRGPCGRGGAAFHELTWKAQQPPDMTASFPEAARPPAQRFASAPPKLKCGIPNCVRPQPLRTHPRKAAAVEQCAFLARSPLACLRASPKGRHRRKDGPRPATRSW